MDTESLRLLLDLAQTRSFSKAAPRHFMSQSAVSQRVREMERELGYTLIERGKGRPGAEFTEAGQATIEAARDILARLESLKQELAERSGQVAGTLRVATVYSIGLHELTPALKTYLSKYPQVNLQLEYLRTDRIYDSLIAGAIDCGIVACPQVRSQVEVLPLGEETMTIVLPPLHPLSEYAEIPIELLENQAFIAFAQDIPTRALTDQFFKTHNVSVRIIQALDNIETIKQIVEIGQGIAFLPVPTVTREVEAGTLIRRPILYHHLTRSTGILLRKGRAPSQALTHFLEVLAP
jgi:LysR family transcriptional regulator, transcriptional activator of the cysJI operon